MPFKKCSVVHGRAWNEGSTPRPPQVLKVCAGLPCPGVGDPPLVRAVQIVHQIAHSSAGTVAAGEEPETVRARGTRWPSARSRPTGSVRQAYTHHRTTSNLTLVRSLPKRGHHSRKICDAVLTQKVPGVLGEDGILRQCHAPTTAPLPEASRHDDRG
jgi:hypothetical protein